MYTVNKLEINYRALALCILAPKMITVEKAFIYFDSREYRTLKSISAREFMTDKDYEDALKLRKELTYREIGEMYGFAASQAIDRLKGYKKRKGIA